jgi:TetR/AcrR family transcriptional regulator, transcriptional repressor for nem operon
MAKPSSLRKRAYDPQGTRGRILDVAGQEFQKRGYHATSMHNVRRAARVPGGSLYHYFPTKKSLGLAVIKERVATSVANTWIEPLRKASSASQGILGVFDAVAGSLRSDDVLGCPLNNLALELSRGDRDFQVALRRVFDEWEKAVAERLSDNFAPNKRESVGSSGMATLIVAVFSGAMALAKTAQNANPLRACRKELARLLR